MKAVLAQLVLMTKPKNYAAHALENSVGTCLTVGPLASTKEVQGQGQCIEYLAFDYSC